MLSTYTVSFFGHRLIENYPTAERRVEHKSGGAWQTMRYAERTGKPIVNLADGWSSSKMLEVQDYFMRN